MVRIMADRYNKFGVYRVCVCVYVALTFPFQTNTRRFSPGFSYSYDGRSFAMQSKVNGLDMNEKSIMFRGFADIWEHCLIKLGANKLVV